MWFQVNIGSILGKEKGRQFQKGKILQWLLNKHWEERQESKKHSTTHGGILSHYGTNLAKENLLVKKRILSVLSVSNKNIELAYVDNGSDCCHLWCQQSGPMTYYTRATVFECLLRGTYLALKSVHGPSTGVAVCRQFFRAPNCIFGTNEIHHHGVVWLFFSLLHFCLFVSFLNVT